MRRAILLGLLQGPTEMAPVSSSAHTILARRLWGCEPDGPAAAADAKGFEVALHAGTALALAPLMAGRLARSLRRLGAAGATAGGAAQRGGAGDGGGGAGVQVVPLRRAAQMARAAEIVCLSAAPAALAGWLAERRVERRLGGPRQVAAGLAIGAVAMAAADRRAQRRTLEQAGPLDGLAIGLAQAAALIPGVSRRGASLTAARLRGFTREDADELSWLAALPVILGAGVLKGGRLIAQRRAPRQAGTLLAGAGASFASTLAGGLLLQRTGLGSAPLSPFAAYRLVIAAAVLRNVAEHGTSREA